MKWPLPDNVPDMTGKHVVITGCTSGIGLQAASQLLSRGACVVMACRSVSKMDTVATSLRAEHNLPSDTARLLQMQVDMCDTSSIRAFAKRFSTLSPSPSPPIHALVLNAGTVRRDWAPSPDDVELTFATNVLGPWLLTILLLPHMAPHSRVVAVSSQTHVLQTSLHFNSLAPESYNGRHAYMQTKLATHFFVHELNKRLRVSGITNNGTVAVVAHPGYAQSNMSSPYSDTNAGWYSTQIMHLAAGVFRQSAEQGAWPIVMAATDMAVSPFFHYGPQVLGVWGAPVRDCFASPYAKNEEQQRRLWEMCEQLSAHKSPI